MESSECMKPEKPHSLQFSGIPDVLEEFRTINWDGETKTVNLAGKSEVEADQTAQDGSISSQKEVLIKLEHIAFSRDPHALIELISKAVNSNDQLCKQVHDNDIFKKFKLTLNLPVMAEVVYPCPPRLILKATASPTFVFEETAEIYNSRTKQIMEGGQAGLEWVHNIITGASEAKNVIHRHEKFVTCKDYKQAADSDPEQLHYLAIATSENLMSIRDLRGETDLAWLETAQKEVPEAICKVFGGRVKKSQIRAYFHYWPTFYRLHIHFTHVQNVNGGVVCDRARLLTDVISALRKDPEHFGKCNLSVGIKQNDLNFSKFEDLLE